MARRVVDVSLTERQDRVLGSGTQRASRVLLHLDGHERVCEALHRGAHLTPAALVGEDDVARLDLLDRTRAAASRDEGALGEAGVGSGALVLVLGGNDLAEGGIVVGIAVGVLHEAVRLEQTGVEPLRAVRRRHLVHDHEPDLVPERLGITVGREVATTAAPDHPGVRHPGHDLLGGALRAQLGEHLGVLPVVRHTCLATVLGGEHVDGTLLPIVGHLDAELELDLTSLVVADDGIAVHEGERGEHVLACRREASPDVQALRRGKGGDGGDGHQGAPSSGVEGLVHPCRRDCHPYGGHGLGDRGRRGRGDKGGATKRGW